MTPLKLALLSLSRHRFATAITVAAIGMSVACGGILLRLHRLSESRFSTMGHGGDAIVGAKAGGIEILLGSLNGEGEFPGFLPYKLFESLRAEQTVTHADGAVTRPSYIEAVVPFVYFARYGDYRVVGTDDTFYRRARPGESLVLSSGAWFSAPGEVVLGASVARAKGVQVGDAIRAVPWTGGRLESPGIDLPEIELRVVGVLTATGGQWDRALFASFAQAHQVFERRSASIAERSIWGPRVLHYFLVYLRPGGFAPLEDLINKRTVGQAVGVEEQKERLRDLSGVGKSVGLFVTAFVILLGGLAVCAMLVTRFEGLSVQIAVLRAIGYTRRELSKWLVWEGFLLGVMGVALGSALDFAGFPALRSLLGPALPPSDPFAGSLFDSAPIWAAAVAATVASVFVPIARMSRQDAHDSLKGL